MFGVDDMMWLRGCASVIVRLSVNCLRDRMGLCEGAKRYRERDLEV